MLFILVSSVEIVVIAFSPEYESASERAESVVPVFIVILSVFKVPSERRAGCEDSTVRLVPWISILYEEYSVPVAFIVTPALVWSSLTLIAYPEPPDTVSFPPDKATLEKSARIPSIPPLILYVPSVILSLSVFFYGIAKNSSFPSLEC